MTILPSDNSAAINRGNIHVYSELAHNELRRESLKYTTVTRSNMMPTNSAVYSGSQPSILTKTVTLDVKGLRGRSHLWYLLLPPPWRLLLPAPPRPVDSTRSSSMAIGFVL